MTGTREEMQEINKLKLKLSKCKQTEKSLLKELELFESCSKDLNVWIWKMDLDGNYTHSNSTIEATLGYKSDEILNENLLNLWLAEEKINNNSFKELGTALKNNVGWKNLPMILQHKDGSKVYTESTAYPIYDKNDKIRGYRGIDHDITKQKTVAEKLKKSEKQLKNFIANVPIGLYRTNEAGDVIMANPALVSILKYDSMEDLLKTNIIKENKINQLERKNFKNEITQNDELIGKESLWLAKDNSKIYIRESAKVMRKENGEVDYYEGSVEDITENKLAKEKLKKSEKQFRMIAENTNDLITISNLNLGAKYTYVSPSIKQVGGFEVDELIGRSAFEFMHPDDKKKMFRYLKKVIKKNISNILLSHPEVMDEVIEYRALHKSGNYRYMQSSGRIIGGKMLFVSRDITEHKEMIEKLRKSEKQFRMIAENTKDTISLQKFDSKMTYLYLSPGFQELTGYSPEEYIGKSPMDLIHPDDRIKLLPILKEYLGSKLKNTLNTQKSKTTITVEYRMKIKSGEWRYFQAVNRVVENKILSVSRDVTEQKLAQVKLTASEHRLKKAKEIAKVEFLEYDLVNEKVFVTERVKFLLNIETKNSVIDPQSIYDITHPDDKVLLKSILEEIHKGISPCPLDYRVLKPNNEILWLNANFELSLDDNKKPKSLFVTLLDITDRKKIAEEIDQARERLSITNSILRHDITNDMIVIKTAVKLYKETSDLKMLDEISKRIIKSLDLIKAHRVQESFLDSFSELKKIELTPMLNHLTEYYNEIEINISGNETVYADSAIYSVFENLLNNSIKHGKASKIDIIIKSYKEICEIKVIDNGKGIEDSIKGKIFDKGFTHGENGNTGIGLHIVRHAIDSYGGRIFVEDNHPKGTVFIINLKSVLLR